MVKSIDYPGMWMKRVYENACQSVKIEDLEYEIVRLKAIASKAIREQIPLSEKIDRLRMEIIDISRENENLRIANERLKHEAYLAAVSETCDVKETGDYYSGFCDGVQAAAAAVERMK